MARINKLRHSLRISSKLARYLLFVSVVLIALFIRVRRLGDDPFFQDQAATSMGALQVARGDRPLVGPMAFSFSTTLRDPPLPSYLYSLPFAVSGDPRVARLFTALWNIFSISIAYKIGKRYFGHGTGLMAASLYAAHPTAVLSSRFIWNPNLAAPIVMLYIYTGLVGYYESRRLARVLHLPTLALAVLCHPSLILLAPITLLFCIWSWTQRPGHRQGLYLHTGLSILAALLLVSPWIAANVRLAIAAPSDTNLTFSGPLLQLREPNLQAFTPILSGEGCGRNQCPMLSGERPEAFLPHILPALTLGATAYTFLFASLKRRVLPILVLITAFYLPPIIASLVGPVWHHYVWPLIGNATLIQGAVVAANHQFPRAQSDLSPDHHIVMSDAARLLRYLYTPIVILVIIGQMRFNLVYDPREGLPSLSDNLAAIKYALHTAQDDGVELILQYHQPPDERRCIGCRGWETLPALLGHDLRVLPQDSGVPAPDPGAYLLRSASWPSNDKYTLEQQPIYDWFHIARIPGPTNLQPYIASTENSSLINGVVILGLAVQQPPKLPQASETWQPAILWRAGNPPSNDYKFFAHLLDSDGTKYAQADPLALPGTFWRAGETVINTIDLTPSSNLPVEGPLYINLGMYDQDGTVPFINDNTRSDINYTTIQIRGSINPAHVFHKSLILDTIELPISHNQGPPLLVNTTWLFDSSIQDAYHITWSLARNDNRLLFLEKAELDFTTAARTRAPIIFMSKTYELRMPTDLPPGEYQVFMDLQNARQPDIRGTISRPFLITERTRSYEPSAPSNPVLAQFGSVFRLLGYDVQQTPSSLLFHLYWHSLEQPQEDYNYFIHLWHNGQIIAQVDSMPAAGEYPTSWWAPGEYYIDAAALDLPVLEPGGYTITLGWYQNATGRRLPITQGIPSTDAYQWITLHTFRVN